MKRRLWDHLKHKRNIKLSLFDEPILYVHVQEIRSVYKAAFWKRVRPNMV